MDWVGIVTNIVSIVCDIILIICILRLRKGD